MNTKINNKKSAQWEEALKSFVQEVRKQYGDRLETVILYGSHARGEASERSDIDLLIILKDLREFWEEFHKISPTVSSVSLRYDVVISAIPMGKKDFENKKTPLLLNVRREGRTVA